MHRSERSGSREKEGEEDSLAGGETSIFSSLALNVTALSNDSRCSQKRNPRGGKRE